MGKIGGGAVTVRVAEAVAPLHAIAATVVFWTGPVLTDPDVGTVRVCPLLEIAQELALVEDQMRVAELPGAMVAGLNAILADVTMARGAGWMSPMPMRASAIARYASGRIEGVFDS